MAPTAESRFIFVETRVGYYRTQYESECSEGVTTDSAKAILCFDLADLVAQGNNLYQNINSLDNDWRTLVFTEVVEYSVAFENRIKRLYQGWLETSKKVVSLFEKLEVDFQGRGFDATPVHDLRKAVREVEAMALPDGGFFVHEKLVDLRDAAIDQCRANDADVSFI